MNEYSRDNSKNKLLNSKRRLSLIQLSITIIILIVYISNLVHCYADADALEVGAVESLLLSVIDHGVVVGAIQFSDYAPHRLTQRLHHRSQPLGR